MKKWLLASVVFIGLLLSIIYIFFPKSYNTSNNENINCNPTSFRRLLLIENKWQNWWPGSFKHDVANNKSVFEYKGYQYTIKAVKYNAVEIETTANDLIIKGTIFLLPLDKNNVEADWKYSLNTNSNPINRVNLYLQAKKVNNNMKDILRSMKTFFEKTDNIYGVMIDDILVKDTILVSTKFSSIEHPSVSKVYSVIDSIRNYIHLHNATETNYPMLHIWQDSGLFKTTIAIHVNITIPGSNYFSIKRMVPGRILVSKVKGGEYSAEEAIRQLGIFISENGLTSPAIPFESLVTNRMEEKDTSKWITKVYYPVF